MADESKTNLLVEAAIQLESSLRIFEEINGKAEFIALSAAIEGARMRSKLGTFAIVAQQISAQASKNSELSELLRTLAHQIKTHAFEAVAVRNLEMSIDLIDKLDRNLFERNCDVQAWATFDLIKNCLENPNAETSKLASYLLDKLNTIYVVYLDSFVVDPTGKVISAARARNLIDSNFSKEGWFQTTLEGNVTVTDLNFYEPIQKHTVMYCSPVLDNNNKIIGVLANCFDWNYAQEMIHSSGYPPKTKAVIINSKTEVIASKRETQILTDGYEWSFAGEIASEKGRGYSTEYARNGVPLMTGFSHTKGYNSYAGKGWSAIISEQVDVKEINPAVTLVQETDVRTTGNVVPLRKQIESEKSGEKLLNTMKDIDRLVDGINASNKEVTLLAVNASIQAGLAGAEGEGFSIIANEVATLAKKSLSFVDTVNSATQKLRTAVHQSSSLRLVDAAKDAMSKIDRNLFERYCDIQAWSTFSAFRKILAGEPIEKSEVTVLLQKIHKIYEVYHDIYILDMSGRVVSTAIDQSLIGQDYQSREWFSAAQQGTIYYSDVGQSQILKTPLISFSAPILSESGSILGVIASRFNVNFLNDIIRATLVDSSSQTYLVNGAGTVVASGHPEDVLKKQFTGLTVLNGSEKGQAGLYDDQNVGGKSFAIGYSSSKGYNTYKGQHWVVLTQRANQPKGLNKELTPAEKFQKKFPFVKAR